MHHTDNAMSNCVQYASLVRLPIISVEEAFSMNSEILLNSVIWYFALITLIKSILFPSLKSSGSTTMTFYNSSVLMLLTLCLQQISLTSCFFFPLSIKSIMFSKPDFQLAGLSNTDLWFYTILSHFLFISLPDVLDI